MSKKEQIKKFLKEHKKEIVMATIVTGGTALLGGGAFMLGRKFAMRNLMSDKVYGTGLVLGSASTNALLEYDVEDGLGKVVDVATIVGKGLETAGSEGHLDDTVIGYMVYTK